MDRLSLLERFRGCLAGLAVGDAIGTTVEFASRGTFEPVTDMVGGGPFGLRAGQWTDDTSMALCLATSLVERNGFDEHDQMERYCRWADDGYLSSTGTCFDIGGTVSSALSRFRQTGDAFAGATDPWSAGNGCIMRLAPIPMFYYSNLEVMETRAGDSSRTTHGAQECIDASRLFGRILWRALSGRSKGEVVRADGTTFEGADKIGQIARGEYRGKTMDNVRGTGYVVDCLEAAMWCFNKANSFEETVLLAANLGDDADTTAAVSGQVAGAHYGLSSVPEKWLDRLAMKDEILRLAGRLCDRHDRSVNRAAAESIAGGRG